MLSRLTVFERTACRGQEMPGDRPPTVIYFFVVAEEEALN